MLGAISDDDLGELAETVEVLAILLAYSNVDRGIDLPNYPRPSYQHL